MKIAQAESKWLRLIGHRLDAGPYVSGAFAVRATLARLRCPLSELRTLCAGPEGGIFNGPKFRRVYVESADYGVPFLGSTSMLHSDFHDLNLLRRTDAESPRLRHLEVKPGMTLMSCSGTIGKMVYVRDDMRGMWSSQHIMKICPNPNVVPPGYLFAYLSSRFGRSLVTENTYGAIIQHVEPEHLFSLPVPRLPNIETAAHSLISGASEKRSKASSLLKQAHGLVQDLLGGPPDLLTGRQPSKPTTITSSRLSQRMDAFYFSERCLYARRRFDQALNTERIPLSAVADVFIPEIFKRLYSSDPAFGVPYLTGADVFQVDPASQDYLMNKVATEYRLVVEAGMILIQEAGQLGGLIGRSVLVGEHLNGFAVSNNMIRVVARDPADAGYLFALLSSDEGVLLIARESAGSSIPHIDAGRIRRLVVPWASESVRARIGALVTRAIALRDSACVMEAEARTNVELAIEEFK